MDIFKTSLHLLEWAHAFWNHTRLGAIVIMVVDEHLAETLLQSQSFWEVLHEFDQVLLAIRVSWIVNKDDALNILLTWSPAFLILEISREIPELDVDLSELGNTCWWVSLEVNDTHSGSWSVNGR